MSGARETRKRGRFITLEGGEGVGKSTQARLLAEALERSGIDVVATREPGGTPAAEEIRQLLVTGDVERWDAVSEALLHCAARRRHLVEKILPSLDNGRWVVCDRFADSTMAYQGYGHGLDGEALRRLHDLVAGGFAPDLTLILDLDEQTGLARAAATAGGEDRYERMDPDFHRRLRQGFLEIAEAEPLRCAVIEAGRPVDVVHADIMGVVGQRLGVVLS